MLCRTPNASILLSSLSRQSPVAGAEASKAGPAARQGGAGSKIKIGLQRTAKMPNAAASWNLAGAEPLASLSQAAIQKGASARTLMLAREPQDGTLHPAPSHSLSSSNSQTGKQPVMKRAQENYLHSRMAGVIIATLLNIQGEKVAAAF